MNIKQNLLPNYQYDIKCPYTMKPKWIVIHNTANDASAMSEISYMIGNNNKVSYHCAIDNERVVQGIPFNRNSWNATDGRNGNGNRKGIALEICYSESGGEKFEDADPVHEKLIVAMEMSASDMIGSVLEIKTSNDIKQNNALNIILWRCLLI